VKPADYFHLLIKVYMEGKLLGKVLADNLILFTAYAEINGGQYHQQMIAGDSFIHAVIWHITVFFLVINYV
jgi:hypothetical protein